MIRADLAVHGMPGRVEQLWARRLAPHRFVVRNLPFFVYGVRLDDEVETDADYSLQRVVRSSGRRVLRVAAPRGAEDLVHAELHPLLEALQMGHEWHGPGYVAVDVAPDSEPEELLELLERRERDGVLHFEFS